MALVQSKTIRTKQLEEKEKQSLRIWIHPEQLWMKTISYREWW